MRWVILTDDFPPGPGGVATWTGAVARGLAEAGHEVSVWARFRPGLAGDGYEVHGVRGPSFGARGGWWLRLAAARAIRRADRVLCSTWSAGIGLIGSSAPIDVVFHGSDATRPPRSERAFHATVGRASRRWAVSAWLAARVAERGHAARVLPAPIDPLPARAPSERPEVWGLLARATPLKGGDRFVRLCAAAGARGVVVGDGPELGAWRALTATLGASVSFVGDVPRREVPFALRGCDLVALLPRADVDGSGGEGLGLALLEAAAVGVPVVGCRTGGVPEAVGPGLILDDPDDVAGSVAAIRGWWRPDRGAEARAWLSRTHGVARVVAALVEPPVGG